MYFNKQILFISKTQFTRFPVYFLPPLVVSAKIKDNQFFPSSFLELVCYLISWLLWSNVRQDFGDTITATFTFPNREYSTSKRVTNSMVYETELPYPAHAPFFRWSQYEEEFKTKFTVLFSNSPKHHPFFSFKLPNSLLYAPASRHCQEFLTLDLVISASSISFKRMQTTAQQTASQLKKCFP